MQEDMTCILQLITFRYELNTGKEKVVLRIYVKIAYTYFICV